MGMGHTMAVMTSSVDMKWATPQEWFDYLDLEFDFTLDPCRQHGDREVRAALHARRRRPRASVGADAGGCL
jgi:hypothetical protein